ncbi:MAG: hypothetical protein ACI4DP_02390 [Candidatus Ornithomonoglobus sp.]
MEIVNIIHQSSDVIEYVYISLFFKLFGFSIYNSIDAQQSNLLSLEGSISVQEIVNIVIADSVSEAKTKFGLSDKLKYIFVSRHGGSENVSIIKFPDLCVGNERNCADFFRKLFSRFEDAGALKKDDVIFNILNEMIEMYIDCDMLDNFYLPFKLLRSDKNVIKWLRRLYACSEKYSDYIMQRKDNLAFASINLRFLVNRICTSMKFFPLYDWSIFLEYIDVLNHIATVSVQQIALLSALILDESKRNIGIITDFYKNSMNEYAYYPMYRLARVYEFQLNDVETAREWLELSTRSNGRYYRSIYKLGVYNDERYNYEEALMYYKQTVSVLAPVINEKTWQANEMAYHIKSCARIMKLNRFFNNNELLEEYGEKIQLVTRTIKEKNNAFISHLCKFIGDKDGQIEKMIYNDLAYNANNHMAEFCSVGFYKKEQIIDTV